MNLRALGGEASTSVGKFFGWWGTELLATVPAGMRSLVVPPTTKLLIEIHKMGTLKLTKITGARREELTTVRPRGDKPNPEDESELKELTEGVDEVVIGLPESCGVRRRVDLPAAARENLRDVLTMEMDRLTPFKADEIYFAHGAPEPGRSKDHISVELTIVPKNLADDVMRMARNLGIEPDVLALGDDGKFQHNLLAPGSSTSQKFRFTAGKAWAAAVIILVVGAIAIPLVKQAQAISGLEATIAQAGGKGGEAETVEQQLAAWRAGMQRVGDLRARTPAAIAVLNDLSNTIPKDTWLTEVQISGTPGQAIIAGFSSNAPSLIAPLEALGSLQAVKFDEPVSFDEGRGKDRFRLSATIVAANTPNPPPPSASQTPPALRAHP